MCMCVLRCSVLSDCGPMDCSPLGSSVHGIFQVRILEHVAISYSRGSSCFSLLYFKSDNKSYKNNWENRQQEGIFTISKINRKENEQFKFQPLTNDVSKLPLGDNQIYISSQCTCSISYKHTKSQSSLVES